ALASARLATAFAAAGLSATFTATLLSALSAALLSAFALTGLTTLSLTLLATFALALLTALALPLLTAFSRLLAALAVLLSTFSLCPAFPLRAPLAARPAFPAWPTWAATGFARRERLAGGTSATNRSEIRRRIGCRASAGCLSVRRRGLSIGESLLHL